MDYHGKPLVIFSNRVKCDENLLVTTPILSTLRGLGGGVRGRFRDCEVPHRLGVSLGGTSHVSHSININHVHQNISPFIVVLFPV